MSDRPSLLPDGRENVIGRIAFGPITSTSELRRFAVTAPVDTAHALKVLRDRVQELAEALERTDATLRAVLAGTRTRDADEVLSANLRLLNKTPVAG